jgi:hypothetical protein
VLNAVVNHYNFLMICCYSNYKCNYSHDMFLQQATNKCNYA